MCWYKRFDDVIISLEFDRIEADFCGYYCYNDEVSIFCY